MSPRDVVYVGHMLDTARKAISKTQGLSRHAYDDDENLRLALTHLVQVIGEAARQVSQEFARVHPALARTRHRTDLTRQFAVLDAVRLIGVRAEAAMAIGFVVLVVAFEPHHLRVAFKRHDVGGDAVEEPAVM